MLVGLSSFLMTMNNPAGRLHSLLTRARKIAPNTKNGDAWQQMLDMPGRDDTLLLQRIGTVFALPEETRRAVLTLENVNHKNLLYWTPGVHQALVNSQPLGAQWNAVREALTDQGIFVSLDYCSDQLSRFRPEPEIEPEAVREIQKHTQDLYDEVLSAEIDEDLRVLLLTHLRDMQTALADYQIKGAAGLSRAAHAAMGDIRMQPAPLKVKVLASELGRRAMAIFRGTAMVVQFGANVLRITDGSEALNEWLLESPPVVTSAPTDSVKAIDGDVVDEDRQE